MHIFEGFQSFLRFTFKIVINAIFQHDFLASPLSLFSSPSLALIIFTLLSPLPSVASTICSFFFPDSFDLLALFRSLSLSLFFCCCLSSSRSPPRGHQVGGLPRVIKYSWTLGSPIVSSFLISLGFVHLQGSQD